MPVADAEDPPPHIDTLCPQHRRIVYVQYAQPLLYVGESSVGGRRPVVRRGLSVRY